MSVCNEDDPRLHDIKTRIRVIPDFPKPGILYSLFISSF